MKETRFIAQNKEKWQEAETLLNNSVKEPEKLSNLFVQVVDDLSYSRTYYPNRSVRVYLNKIARQYFSIIYTQKKGKQNLFRLFWLDEMPQIIIHSKRELFISLIIFLLSMSIGVFSSYNDPQFASTILGSDYITQTDANIASGDPMAIYKQSHQVDMFLGITFNNLMVAFRTYVLGIFLGIGTLGSLLFNGIMVGCFQYHFIERGLFVESASSIWLHGTLEISSIVLAGGAGLTLGSGLIFPGTYSRLQSLQISGIRSLKLMLGITPVFVLAAVIESFLTRYTEAPLFLKVSLIALSAVFIIGYFVLFPWFKSKSGFEAPLTEIRLQPTNYEVVNFVRIKNNADLLKDTFQFYARHNTRLLPTIFVVSLGISLASLLLEKELYILIQEEWWIVLLSDIFFALKTPSPAFIILNALGASIILYRVSKLIDAEFRKKITGFDVMSFLQILVITSAIYAAVYIGSLGILFAFAAFGVLIFSTFIVVTQKKNLFQSIAYGWSLYRKNNNQGMSMQFTILLLSFSLLLLLSAPLLYMHMNVLEWNFVSTDPWSQKAIHFIETFLKQFSFYLVLPMITASMAYLYFSQEEATTARNLKETIKKMSERTSKTDKQ